MFDSAVLNSILTVLVLLIPLLFRKRIFRWLFRASLAEAWSYAFEETEAVDESGAKARKLTLKPQAVRLLAVLAPALVQETIKNLKIRLPQFAPVNPATGELDFMAPILAKAAAGKKLSVEDAIPFLLSKAEPLLNQVFGGFSFTGKKPNPKEPKELVNPFLQPEVR